MVGWQHDHSFFKHRYDVLVMAHRGGRGLWPEDTLYAFGRAVELGVDGIITDHPDRLLALLGR